MKKKRIVRLILLVLLLIFVVLQFIPVDRSVPEYDPAHDFVSVVSPPAHLAPIIREACYDCHSYETEYPWYSYVAPVSMWLQNHIDEAREHVNFSLWHTYNAEDKDEALEDCTEMVDSGSMPLKSFTWMHPEARLTDEEREELATWFDGARD